MDDSSTAILITAGVLLFAIVGLVAESKWQDWRERRELARERKGWK